MKDPTSKESEPDPLAIGTLVIAHQDEDLSYCFKQGGYCIADGAIIIAVETQATKDDQDPDCAFITLERYPLKTPIAAGDIFSVKEVWPTMSMAFSRGHMVISHFMLRKFLCIGPFKVLKPIY
jgi:hypothetical protein